MDLITHALASAALARAGLDRTTPMAMPMMVVAGIAADLDWLSYFGGASAFLRSHDSLLHSLAGSFFVAVVAATVFWLAGRNHPRAPLRFWRALLVCAIAAAAHLALDLTKSNGIRLLWPFRDRWFAWDLAPGTDPWIVFLLLGGLLLPALFRMVSEEIGAKRKQRPPVKGAIAALALVVMYLGARAELHAAAERTLLSEDYHGALPIQAGAFPDSASPLKWRGVVDTTNTIEVAGLSLEPGSNFNANASLTHFKPEPSPALAAALKTPAARRFLRYSQFPLANLETEEYGFRVILRDVRFPAPSASAENIVALVELDRRLAVRSQKLRFARDVTP